MHTYGREALENKNYQKYLEVVFDVKQGADRCVALCLALVMSFRFINYAYCFLIGSFMKLNGVKGAYGQDLSGADIYIVMSVVMIGVATLGVISFYA